MTDVLNIDGDIYETVPDEARVATEYLIRIKDRLGIPDDVEVEGENPTLISYALQVYKVWAALYPEEHYEFVKNTEFELKYERPVKDAIKSGGYFPLSYPMRLEALYRILMPKLKIQDKRFWMPLLKQIPELKRTNYFK